MYLHLSGRSAQHKFFFSFPFYFVLFFWVGVWGLEDSISEILLGQVRDGLWPLQSQWFFVLVFILFCLLLVTSSLPGLQSVLLGPFICVFILFINFCRIWYFLFTYHKKRKKTMYIFHSMSYQHFSQNDMMYIW